MNKYEVRRACREDIAVIAHNVRQPDREELWAAGHLEPYKAIELSFMVSRDTSFTGMAGGKPVCMFGVKKPSLLNSVAVPWMIASEDLEFHSREFLRRSRDLVKALSRTFPHMENYVDARNVVAVRWLQWVGFSVYYPKEYGLDKMPFHRFEMRA